MTKARNPVVAGLKAQHEAAGAFGRIAGWPDPNEPDPVGILRELGAEDVQQAMKRALRRGVPAAVIATVCRAITGGTGILASPDFAGFIDALDDLPPGGTEGELA